MYCAVNKAWLEKITNFKTNELRKLLEFQKFFTYFAALFTHIHT